MPPNVCVVVLDAVRAGNLSGYGHDRRTTPNIDAILDESVMFTRACSPTGVTIDSTASLLSGRYPMEHQSGRAGRLNVESPLLPEVLRDSGYRTGAVTCNPFLSPAFGFDVGFDEMNAVTQHSSSGMNMRRFYSETKHLPPWRRYLTFARRAADRNAVSHLRNALQFRFDLFEGDDDGASQATDWAIDFMTDADTPWFLYAHFTETHMNSADRLPYSVPDDDALRFLDDQFEDLPELHTRSREVDYSAHQRDVHERLYDGAIHYLDRKVGDIVDELKTNEEWNDTLFILTADHGELLGEHGLLGHGYLYEPGVRVPLVMKLPGNEGRRGDTIESRVNTLSLFRTLLEYVDLSVPEPVRGGNILSERPETVLVQDYSQTWDWSQYEGEVDGRHAVYRDETKLIMEGDETTLFDLRTDPNEDQDVSEDSPERVSQLRSELTVLLDSMETEVSSDGRLNVGDETRDRLSDLGYL